MNQPPRHGHQQDVADAMSQRVVDVLEMVQVKEQHGQRTAPRLLLFNVALGALRQERTIGQIGEGVEMREALDAVLRLALERDVAEQRVEWVVLPLPSRTRLTDSHWG